MLFAVFISVANGALFVLQYGLGIPVRNRDRVSTVSVKDRISCHSGALSTGPRMSLISYVLNADSGR